jgi:hypothetical protein
MNPQLRNCHNSVVSISAVIKFDFLRRTIGMFTFLFYCGMSLQMDMEQIVRRLSAVVRQRVAFFGL